MLIEMCIINEKLKRFRSCSYSHIESSLFKGLFHALVAVHWALDSPPGVAALVVNSVKISLFFFYGAYQVLIFPFSTFNVIVVGLLGFWVIWEDLMCAYFLSFMSSVKISWTFVLVKSSDLYCLECTLEISLVLSNVIKIVN